MKTLVCGKGGSGKSTVAALLAKSMARRGYRVLVVDSDESNYGLHRQLGLDLPEPLMSFFGGKKEMIGKKLYFVLNKVDADSKESMLKSLDSDKVAAAVPEDKRIFMAGLAGEVIDLQIKEIEQLADLIGAKA